MQRDGRVRFPPNGQMITNRKYDAVIIGSGPNGLAAAIVLAKARKSVLVIEGSETTGGGLRSKELTLPGFVHDVCSAIHPLGFASPFFRNLPLHEYGLRWIQPRYPLAHPLDDGPAVVIERSVVMTAKNLGPDAEAYKRVMSPLVNRFEQLIPMILGPLRFPRYPFLFSWFGLLGVQPVSWFTRSTFRSERTRAVLAGMAAHSMLPLNRPITTALGLTLAVLAHAVGWPLPLGGSQNMAQALTDYFLSLGGQVITDTWVDSVNNLPPSQGLFFDVTPRQLLKIAGDCFPDGYRKGLDGYRYGPGVYKVDYALDGPIPWKSEACSSAGTVHLGGTLAEIEESEQAVWEGKHPEKPFVIAAQQSMFDPQRAPAGSHTLWAYCHVPSGSTIDMSEQIDGQIERFAPGFRNRIIARHAMTAAEMEMYNPNYIGGDINGGHQDWRQLFTRPVLRMIPYSTPNKRIFLCSSSTPPGGGVHGMCGYFAAQTALRSEVYRPG